MIAKLVSGIHSESCCCFQYIHRRQFKEISKVAISQNCLFCCEQTTTVTLFNGSVPKFSFDCQNFLRLLILNSFQRYLIVRLNTLKESNFLPFAYLLSDNVVESI